MTAASTATSAQGVKPLELTTPTGFDSDFESARLRMVTALVGAAPDWTDHNIADPGTTVLEAAAFALSDLHYRVASARFSSWPSAWPGWLDDAERHWSGTLPPPSEAGELTTLANALRAVLTAPGRDAEREVAQCRGRAEAESLLAQGPFASAGDPATRAAVVTALRWSTVRRVALEHTDVIADAVSAADEATLSPTERDARAAAEIEARIGFWPEECQTLVRRERRRQLRELADFPLTADAPESLETADGHTEVWPPHPLQALTCEPVTNDDYAARARTHAQVGRAWAVRGRLPGIAWNGLPTLTPLAASGLAATNPLRFLVEDPDAEAITLVVETATPNPSDSKLREILARAVGTEAFYPFNPWRDVIDANDPRRLMCDEVGIAPLRITLVRVRATLLIPPTANRAQVTAAATSAIDTFLETGQPHDDGFEATASLDAISGPWPPAPQPRGGWVPGEAIRLSEVVAQVVAIPEVIAVRELRIGNDGTGEWASGANGALPIPVGHVPRRSVYDCFTTEFLVDGGCDA